MLEISVTPATDTFLVQLEVQGLSKLPLLLVKAIEVIRTQFERCRHMQQIRRPGAEFGRRLSRQLACPLKDQVR